MGDGTKESPLTREDVLRLIQENGGTARGLDLSGKTFVEGIDLCGLALYQIILRDTTLKGAHLEGAELLYAAHLEGAYLWGAHLEGSKLEYAHLEGAFLGDAHFEEANLRGAHLRGAKLGGAHFEGANLKRARLEGAFLGGVEFSPDTGLGDADWGNYILGEEKEGDFDWAADIYRRLKQWHTSAGMYDIAGEFYFREMEARRKNYWWQDSPSKSFRELLRPFYLYLLNPEELLRAIFPRKPLPWAWSKLLSLLCGYGERPLRVIASALAVFLGLALIYFAIGTLTPNTFLNSLYYSAVSFTALGYGKWAPEPTGWVKGLGAAEAFAGVFMMALFLITFTRKMTR